MPHNRLFAGWNYLIALASALALSLLLAFPCQAAQTLSEKETPLRTKEVYIKGTKVRLPIPDGYEEMQREDAPKIYDWLMEISSGKNDVLLACFINSEDKAALNRGMRLWICGMESLAPNLYIGMTLSGMSGWNLLWRQ